MLSYNSWGATSFKLHNLSNTPLQQGLAVLTSQEQEHPAKLRRKPSFFPRTSLHRMRFTRDDRLLREPTEQSLTGQFEGRTEHGDPRNREKDREVLINNLLHIHSHEHNS